MFKRVSEGMTREEVAKAMNITEERVRQIEEGALRKLKHVLEQRGYKLEDLLERS